MNDPDPTLTMHPPVSSAAANQPQETLIQRGAFDPPATPGTLGRLDRFEVLRLLGEGGMGQVYLAREPRTDTRVAIKILRPQAADEPQTVHRFLTEARHMYRLSHPRILRVLEVSDRPAGPYYVMPYIEGGSLLGQYKPGQPLSDDRILSIAKQVAEALAHAHSHGLIHRDLKPGNVLLDKEGNAYLTDFGLVRTVFNDSMVDASASHLEGTAPYMSPAVARGEAEDTRCDIYAFGALLYELLAGQPPYSGRTPQMILDQILKGPPKPVREVNPKANPVLVRIAEGCMARELRDRYASMGDVVADLDRAARNVATHGSHPQRPGRWPRLAAALVGILAVAALASVAVRHFRPGTPSVPGISIQPGATVESTAPTANALPAHSPTVAADQFPYTYTTNNGAITITKYTGPGGAVAIPSKVGGLPVAEIGDGAFMHRSDVTGVTIPNGVTHIGGSTFYASGLTNFTIPKGVTSFGGGSLAGCGWLVSIQVDAENPAYMSSMDGVVFDKDMTKLVRYPGGKPGSYAIPSSVKSIMENAFSACSALTSITIPNGVTNIADYAFADCVNLTDIVLPDSVTSLGFQTFNGLRGLTSLAIPKNVSSIAAASFRSCSGLTSFAVDADNSAYSSSNDGVLFDHEKTCLVSYPGGKAGSYDIPNSVTRIGPKAFQDCTYLTSVTTPKSVTSIGFQAYYGCKNLTAIYFEGNAPWIDSDVFAESNKATIYCRPGTKGWAKEFGGRPTAVWVPSAQEGGSADPFAESDGSTRLTDGLLAYFPLDGNMIDASGNGHDGKAHGAIRFVETDNGKALDLDGYSWVMLPDDRFLDGSSNATIAFWFNTRTARELRTAFGAGDKRSGQDPISVQLDCANRVMSCGLSDLTAHTTVQASSRVSLDALSTNEWHFFALALEATRGQTQLRVYIDGNMAEDQIAETRVPIRYDTSMRTSIGASGDAGMAWVGGLDEVRIYSRALSPREVKTLFVTRQPAALSAIAPISPRPYTYTTNNGAIAITKYVGPGGTVTIPEVIGGLPVKTIGGGAFAGCATVTDIGIPKSVSSIAAWAFADCVGLSSIVIPEGLTDLDGLAFSGCAQLTRFTVDTANPVYRSDADGVLFDKEGTALVICPAGKKGSYAIPKEVTTIGNAAFVSCDKLTALTIPASVIRIPSGGVFGNCPLLKRIDVDSANPAFISSADGVLFNKEKNMLIRCPGEMEGRYEIPASVRHIGGSSFSGCKKLSTVTLPDDTVSIGRQAFICCDSLTAVAIPDKITSIGGHTFARCSALMSVTVGHSVTNIESWAFSACGNLASVRFLGDAPTLGQEVFTGSDKTTIYYRPGTKGWGKELGGRPTAVWENAPATAQPTASSLQTSSASLQPAASLPETGIYDFACTAADGAVTIAKYTGEGGAVVIPAKVNGLPVTAIKDAAFQNCTGVTSIAVPNSVTNIGFYAFRDCPQLKRIGLGGITSIPNDMFNGHTNLTSVTIPDTVTNIGSGAFKDCTRLAEVDLGTGVICIPNAAFYNCPNLPSVTIPNSVTAIGEEAFLGCSKSTHVNIPASVTSIGGTAFLGCRSLVSIMVDVLNPVYSSSADGIVFNKEKTWLFRFPTGMAGSYTIPSTIKGIGANAFRDCSSLIGVTIPDGVADIQDWAFASCEELLTVNLPHSITGVSSTSFSHCSRLSKITVDDANGAYCSKDGVLFSKDGTSLVRYPGGKAGNYEISVNVSQLAAGAFEGSAGLTSVAIPDSVTAIEGSTFRRCFNLASITIPDSVASIGGEAFNGCTNLTTVKMGAGVTNIADWAFVDCSKLASIRIPNRVNSVGLGTFKGCRSLASVVLPDGLTRIRGMTFDGCSNLTSLTIPDGVTDIEDCAFRGCASLPSVKIPDGITTINGHWGGGTFSGCASLGSVTIPDTVKTLGVCAFSGCANLTRMTVGKSVGSIENWVFAACAKLTHVYFEGDAPSCASDGNVFYGVENATVYYRPGTKGWGPTFAGRPTAVWEGKEQEQHATGGEGR